MWQNCGRIFCHTSPLETPAVLRGACPSPVGTHWDPWDEMVRARPGSNLTDRVDVRVFSEAQAWWRAVADRAGARVLDVGREAVGQAQRR